MKISFARVMEVEEHDIIAEYIRPKMCGASGVWWHFSPPNHSPHRGGCDLEEKNARTQPLQDDCHRRTRHRRHRRTHLPTSPRPGGRFDQLPQRLPRPILEGLKL